jgi:acyl-coenzyme A thioesterase PaaI-like protein
MIFAEASVIRRGRTTVLVEVRISSEEGKELTRVTVTMFCIAPAAK